MEELDLKELISMFWSKKVYIALIILIFGVIGFIYTFVFVTPKYQSSTTLVLAKRDKTDNTTTDTITQTDITLNQKLVSTYSEIVRNKTVLRQVMSNLKISGLEENALRKNVTVSSVKDTELIKITVANENPNYAAQIANEIATVFTEKVGEIYNINNVYVLDSAEVDENPYNINHMKDIIIFLMIGVVVSFVYVILSNLLDTTVKSAEDIEKSTGLLILAQMPVYEFEGKTGGRK